jgi:hypothetical protein
MMMHASLRLALTLSHGPYHSIHVQQRTVATLLLCTALANMRYAAVVCLLLLDAAHAMTSQLCSDCTVLGVAECSEMRSV